MSEELSIEKKLAEEIDQLPWSALVRHFAFGRVYVVRKALPFLDAALILHRDNANELKDAMAKDSFGVPTAEEAKAWHDADQKFHVLVISPFVLIQAID